MTEKLSITAKERIVYYINVEDLQRVANAELERDLTEEEIKHVEEKLGDYVSWYEAISLAIGDIVDDTDEIVS
ncbi:hypothetical protein GF348_02205 [candidate division KSB3 bacterium]|nr:hypothetical protein [candidate division KSB3 bacterium]